MEKKFTLKQATAREEKLLLKLNKELKKQGFSREEIRKIKIEAILRLRKEDEARKKELSERTVTNLLTYFPKF